MAKDKRAALIAKQNDLFRRTHHPLLGRVCITDGVMSMGDVAVLDAVMTVVRFDQFTEDNDPYGEHDFGAFDLRGVKLFWKIDYYSDDRMVLGSRDPSDASQTFRLLTIMLASEY